MIHGKLEVISLEKLPEMQYLYVVVKFRDGTGVGLTSLGNWDGMGWVADYVTCRSKRCHAECHTMTRTGLGNYVSKGFNLVQGDVWPLPLDPGGNL